MYEYKVVPVIEPDSKFSNGHGRTYQIYFSSKLWTL